MNIQQQIASLLAERAELDAELEKLREQAMAELDAAKAAVESIEAVLQPSPSTALAAFLEAKRNPARPTAKPVASEIDETDAGNGIREVVENTSAASFQEELAALRERTAEKRRRLQ